VPPGYDDPLPESGFHAGHSKTNAGLTMKDSVHKKRVTPSRL
jgi:hypothetical protein